MKIIFFVPFPLKAELEPFNNSSPSSYFKKPALEQFPCFRAKALGKHMRSGHDYNKYKRIYVTTYIRLYLYVITQSIFPQVNKL